MSTPPTSGRALVSSSSRVSLPSLSVDPLPIHVIAPAPCTAACPAGVNVKAYVSLIAEGRFAEALEVVRRRCTLPSVCGRICHAPCEPACRRVDHDDPLAIRALKRFVSDLAREAPTEPLDPPSRAERVAIVGSGPAGLTAAFDLRRAGFAVTILEAMPKPGGMLRYGIADYRLPPEVLDAEIDVLLSSGIELQTETRIVDYAEVTGLLTGGYSAVLLALGAQNGRLLDIGGEEEAAPVEDALAFLRRVNSGDRNRLSGKVVVIGGGSTAIEAARTALRLGGAPVEVVYRRSRAELRAGPEEIAQAEEEGITFRFLTAPLRVVVRDRSLQGLKCHQVALGERDAEGRPRPVPIPGSEVLVEADQVLVAVGQIADLDFISGPAVERLVEQDLLRADPATAMTAQWGLFAAGDVVSGPTTVIEAIASGHEAACAIVRYLETGTPDRKRSTGVPPAEFGLTDPDPVEVAGVRSVMRRVEAGLEFAEVEQPYTAAEAVAEAARCLRCGPCHECAVCAPGCDRRHLLMRLETTEAYTIWAPLRVSSDIARRLGTNGALSGTLARPSAPMATDLDLRPMRVRYAPDLCRGCDRCIEVCSFEAFRHGSSVAPDAPVQFDPAVCRGCALCSAVCPTGALTPVAHSPEWWEAIGPVGDLAPQHLTLACDTGAPPGTEAGNGDMITCRCVGQAHPGMLLDLFKRGTEQLTVVPCSRCRFGAGSRLAAQHVAESNALLQALGRSGTSVRLAAPRLERV